MTKYYHVTKLLRKFWGLGCDQPRHIDKISIRTLSKSTRNFNKKDDSNEKESRELQKKEINNSTSSENKAVTQTEKHENEELCLIENFDALPRAVPSYSGLSKEDLKNVLHESPLTKISRIVKYSLTSTMENHMDRLGFEYESQLSKYTVGPAVADVVIIGGGAIGSSCAYWLRERAGELISVLVIERDPTYKSASTSLSVGGLRQQFSLPESIEMSLFGAEFMRTAGETLKVEGLPTPHMSFEPYGYLLLASEEGAETLTENSRLQNSLGARNILLNPRKLRERFPWLNTNGIALGCLGLENEGWFDPWALMLGFKSKAASLGVDYVHGEVVGFRFGDPMNAISMEQHINPHPTAVMVKRPDGVIYPIMFSKCIIAAGADSGAVGRSVGLGLGNGFLKYPLPVERRKRYVYCFHCPEGPGLNTPLTVDPTGVYFRREGLLNHYIAGLSPTLDEEPPTDNLDVDHQFFDERVWPLLADRIPCFESLKVKSAWAGYYEYNPIDMNGIVGRHPLFTNLYFACGFSGHGIQHAPAVGRALSELIIHGCYKTIDLSRLEFRRFISREIIKEKNIV